MKHLFFLTVFIFSSFGLKAQANLTEEFVLDLFDKPEKVKWLRYYKGRIDDINEVMVTLAFDGKYCKGQMVYLRSRERLRLDGTLKENVLKLKEINHAAAVSGQLEGIIDGSSVVLDWSNIDHSLGATIDLEETSQEEFTASDCGDNKWFRIYRGLIFGSSVELILQKDSESGIRGMAWFEQDKISYQVKGDISDQGSFKMALQDDYHKLKGTINGQMKGDDQFAAHFYKPDGQKCPTLFSMEEQLDMGCQEFADYMTGYDAIYPQTSHHSFNYWINGVCNDWVHSCEDYSASIKARHSSADPKLRASVRSYAWSDISFYDDQLVSGFMTFSNAWEMSQKGKAFTYDLRNGKEITLEDVFISDFDYKIFLKKYINKNIVTHELYKDYDFRQWLVRQDFPFFNLKHEGITFSTQFDMVYGKQQITIPYSILKPYIKMDNPIKHVIK